MAQYLGKHRDYFTFILLRKKTTKHLVWQM